MLSCVICLFSFILLLFYFYNVVLVSAKQQFESAIIIHVFPPSRASLHSPLPTFLGQLRTTDWAPCVIWQLLTTVYFTYNSVYMLLLLSPFVPLTFSLTVSPSPFALCISFPSLKIGSSIQFFYIPHVVINKSFLIHHFHLGVHWKD